MRSGLAIGLRPGLGICERVPRPSTLLNGDSMQDPDGILYEWVSTEDEQELRITIQP